MKTPFLSCSEKKKKEEKEYAGSGQQASGKKKEVKERRIILNPLPWGGGKGKAAGFLGGRKGGCLKEGKSIFLVFFPGG